MEYMEIMNQIQAGTVKLIIEAVVALLGVSLLSVIAYVACTKFGFFRFK